MRRIWGNVCGGPNSVRMKGSNFAVMVFALLLALLCLIELCSALEVSVACMIDYDSGGARSVFLSPECPQWEWVRLIHSPRENTTSNCDFASATIQGHRNYQEDRIVCNSALKIPSLDGDELTIGIAAVFDGHGGSEASELASKKFLDYFLLNVVFKTYKDALSYELIEEPDGVITFKSAHGTLSLTDSDTLLKGTLREALTKTFEDIDSEFSEEALKQDYISGSTGTVVLLVNGQALVGYVGDSKALLCSDPTQTSQVAEGISSRAGFAEELTIDHNPSRADEKARIEASGGFIRTWGVPRVNGLLAMTRAIGDLTFKRYGVIAEPEVTGWRTLTSDNSFLVVGTDGIFEGLTPSDVCAVLNDKSCTRKNTLSGNSSCLTPSALANHIVYSAFENGSTDNISVIIIPLD
ncbi:OLC1v1007202C1 [Oldenlandia corymbosa var. corymbosa]|uniref:OLC1v1007202C1 n=1 Tax=Oldenlandia corymbosa var. corymbosa TaxID=529605 RepID=A0AAV1DIU0_OLDCO|nr:OLC1v1007202C1 [Oldenlandia corymbosa var. corymbosa]